MELYRTLLTYAKEGKVTGIPLLDAMIDDLREEGRHIQPIELEELKRVVRERDSIRRANLSFWKNIKFN